MLRSGGDCVRSTELTTPTTWEVMPTELPEPSVPVAVILYCPSGHWVPSVPWPFQVKGWFGPAATEEKVLVYTVWPLLLVILTVTLELAGTFSSQVADELVSDAVSPETTAALPTKVSAWGDCAVCCSDTSVASELLVLSCC